MNTTKERVWTTYNGNKIPFGELSHQHLSNILWFYEIIHNYRYTIMEQELNNRFGGERLLWRPLPIGGEISWLRRNGHILGNAIIKHGGNQVVLIGEIGHISPEDMIKL